MNNNFIQIGTFSDSLKANMAKDVLLSNGISCIVTGDEFKIFNLLSDGNSPIQLKININDKSAAEELLALFFSDNNAQ